MNSLFQLSQFLRNCNGQEILVHDSPFLEAAYLNGLEKALGIDAEIFVADDESFALALFGRQGYQGKTLPPFTPFSQIWVTDPLSASLDFSDLDSFFETIKGRHHIHLSPGLSVSNIGESWVRNEFLTYHIDTKCGIWRERYSTSVKRLLKKYSDQCHVEQDDQMLSFICELVGQSYARSNRRPPLELKEMQVLGDSCLRAGLATCYVVKDGGTAEVKAGVVVLKSQSSAYYWLAGGEKGPWMTVLVDRILQDLSIEGIGLFDFMGANTPRIAEFKRRFGGDLVSYTGYEKLVGLNAKLRNGISSFRENAG